MPMPAFGDTSGPFSISGPDSPSLLTEREPSAESEQPATLPQPFVSSWLRRPPFLWQVPFKSLVCPRLSQRQSCGLGCAPGLCHLLQGDREDGAPCITDPGSLMAPMAMHPILVPFQCPLPLLTQPSTKTGNARLPWSKWLTAAIPASRA